MNGKKTGVKSAMTVQADTAVATNNWRKSWRLNHRSKLEKYIVFMISVTLFLGSCNLVYSMKGYITESKFTNHFSWTLRPNVNKLRRNTLALSEENKEQEEAILASETSTYVTNEVTEYTNNAEKKTNEVTEYADNDEKSTTSEAETEDESVYTSTVTSEFLTNGQGNPEGKKTLLSSSDEAMRLLLPETFQVNLSSVKNIQEIYRGVYLQKPSPKRKNIDKSPIPACVFSSNPRHRSIFSTNILMLSGSGRFRYEVFHPTNCMSKGTCENALETQHPNCHFSQPTIILNDYTRCCHKERFRAIRELTSKNFFDISITSGDEYCDIKIKPQSGDETTVSQYRQYYTDSLSEQVGYLPLGPRFEFERIDAAVDIKPAWDRKFLFNFVGSLNTNRIRYEMVKFVKSWLDSDELGMTIKEKKAFFLHEIENWRGRAKETHGYINPKEYRTILKSSIFTLAPAGHNPEAYRIYESIEAGSIPILALDRSYLRGNGCSNSFQPFLESGAPFPFVSKWSEVQMVFQKAMNEPYWVQELQINCTIWLRKFMQKTAAKFEYDLEKSWNQRLLETGIKYDNNKVVSWLRKRPTIKTNSFLKESSSLSFAFSSDGDRVDIESLKSSTFWGNKGVATSSRSQKEVQVCVIAGKIRKSSNLFYEEWINRYSSTVYRYHLVTSPDDCTNDVPRVILYSDSDYSGIDRGLQKASNLVYDVAILMCDLHCEDKRKISVIKPHFRQFFSEHITNSIDGGRMQNEDAPIWLPLGPRVEFIRTQKQKHNQIYKASSERSTMITYIGSVSSADRSTLFKLSKSPELSTANVAFHFTSAPSGRLAPEKGYLKPSKYYEILSDSKFCLVPGGHGIETNRLYEALETGCIPVVRLTGYYLTHPCEHSWKPMLYGADRAPFIWVDDWAQVTDLVENFSNEPTSLVDAIQKNVSMWYGTFMKKRVKVFESVLNRRFQSRTTKHEQKRKYEQSRT